MRVHTDILGGCAAGMRTVLVSAHGLFAECDYRDNVSPCGIVPDFACEKSEKLHRSTRR
ncbi:HAD hydrolase-like protein [Marivita sp.]|uniref:HAD hydrolase-like protein n=1 Tax=Marivita sp. TaxID=2003365 RepID=UPI00341D2955